MPDLPADQRALLAAVIAAPDDDTPRLVYADWLDDHGDAVQANYIRESVRLATLLPADPERSGLAARLTAVIRDHSNGWAERLGLHADVPRRLYRRGFVHTIEFGSLAGLFGQAPGWFDSAPVLGLTIDFGQQGYADDDREVWWEEHWEYWERLPVLPGLGRLRALAVRGIAFSDEDCWGPVLDNPALAGLRELDVARCDWAAYELGLLAEQPHLARLEVLDLGEIADVEAFDGVLKLFTSPVLRELRAVYFDDIGVPEGDSNDLPRHLVDRLNARFGDRWGNRRPPPPVWC